MSTYNLGKISITPKGEYSPSAQYERLDAVFSAGGSFICLQPCTGINPVTDPLKADYWSAFAAGIAEVTANYSAGRVYLTLTLTGGEACTVNFPVTELPDQSVSTGKLAPGAVTAAKLAAGAVTPAKLSGPVPLDKGGTGAGTGDAGLANLLAAGPAVLSSHQYGTSLPSSGSEGQIFFLIGE